MKWMYRISIKDQFEDVTTPELIIRLCDSLSKQLKRVIKNTQNSNQLDEESFYYVGELDMIESNFDFLRKLASGEIAKSEWGDYDFNGDFEKDFNRCLSELYDLGDTRTKTKQGETFKFLWIG